MPRRITGVRSLQAGAGIAATRVPGRTFTIRRGALDRAEKPPMTQASRLSAAVLCAILITGCAARGVRIAELQDRPDKYDHKTVSVNGVVTSSFGIPLVPFQLYKVDDGSGEITVLSRSGRAPRKGARVQVKGRLNELGTFGGTSVGLHIEERDRKIKS
jgi:hypothetical protein